MKLGLAVLLLVPLASSAAVTTPPLVLHDVDLVPLTDDRVVRSVSVLVEDGRIATIGQRETLLVPEGAIVVEARGHALLPGLIEMHAHQLDRQGTVEVGKDADLILVEGDPLADLDTVRVPVGVVVQGRWLDQEEIERLRGRTFGDDAAARSALQRRETP